MKQELTHRDFKSLMRKVNWLKSSCFVFGHREKKEKSSGYLF